MTVSVHQFRVTKYDPSLRAEGGAYFGDDWTSINDIGRTFRGRQQLRDAGAVLLCERLRANSTGELSRASTSMRSASSRQTTDC